MRSISGNKYGFFLSKPFTLLELVIVLAIIILFSAIIVSNISIPVFVTLDKTSKSVRSIFSDAQRQSAVRGVEVNVEYYPEQKELRLLSGGNSSEGISGSIPTGPGFDGQSSNSQSNFRVPAKVGVEFPEYQLDVIQYRFFPDGSASGPEMTLSLKGRKIVIGVSRLTGIAYSREEEE